MRFFALYTFPGQYSKAGAYVNDRCSAAAVKVAKLIAVVLLNVEFPNELVRSSVYDPKIPLYLVFPKYNGLLSTWIKFHKVLEVRIFGGYFGFYLHDVGFKCKRYNPFSDAPFVLSMCQRHFRACCTKLLGTTIDAAEEQRTYIFVSVGVYFFITLVKKNKIDPQYYHRQVSWLAGMKTHSYKSQTSSYKVTCTIVLHMARSELFSSVLWRNFINSKQHKRTFMFECYEICIY